MDSRYARSVSELACDSPRTTRDQTPIWSQFAVFQDQIGRCEKELRVLEEKIGSILTPAQPVDDAKVPRGGVLEAVACESHLAGQIRNKNCELGRIIDILQSIICRVEL